MISITGIVCTLMAVGTNGMLLGIGMKDKPQTTKAGKTVMKISYCCLGAAFLIIGYTLLT